MHHTQLAENPLRTRADVQRAMLDLWRPLRSHLVRDGAAVALEATEASYGEPSRLLEAFVRPLWGLIPLELGGGAFPDWPLYAQGLAEGVDPRSPRYWGAAADNDQRLVEMAVIGFGLALLPEKLWEPLPAPARRNLVEWLSQINRFRCVDNNWLFFRVLVNLGLRRIGAPWDEAQLAANLARLEGFYKGAGWFTDGPTSQRDYYIPMAMHYYGLLYARLSGGGDQTTATRFAERAKLFAPQFAAWFAPDGAALPIGRSLTYRFAQGAFWGALAYAGIEALPWGVMKGIYLRHLRWWLKQPCFTESGLLTIGYRYPNLGLAEAYNGPGGPYWACKAFLPLALPASHPFWQAEEQAHPAPVISVQPHAGLVVCRDEGRGHVFALSSNQPPTWKPRHAAQKYAKFAYSTVFGFSVQIGGVAPEYGGGESMLLLTDDGRDWRGREDFAEEKYSGHTLFTCWRPWPDVEVSTWLVPALPGHLRMHRVRSARPLRSYEGGFSVDRVRQTPRHTGRPGRAEADYDTAFSAVRDLAGARLGVVTRMDPNLNVLWPLTSLPGLSGGHPAGEYWLATAVVGLPGTAQAVPGRAWLESFSLDPAGPVVRQGTKVVWDRS
ncbi:MAG: DUF2264 domain-containing protein [Opitutaceae bacterium]|nr:DUF2264 domain-containing protein [Opitutaceae bacterium]